MGRPDLIHQRERRRLLAILVACDAIAVMFAAGAAGLLRLRTDEVLPIVTLGLVEHHLVASVAVVPLLVLLFRIQGLYDLDQILVGTREYAQIVHGVTYGTIITLAVSYFAGGSPIVSRSWLLLVWVLAIVAVGGSRFAVRRVVRWLRGRGILHTRVLVIGASNLGIAIAEQLQAAESEGLDVVGFLDEYLPLGQPLVGDIRVIGRPQDLLDGSAAQLADEYVLVSQALPHQRLEEITRMMAHASQPVLRMVVGSRDLLTNGVVVAERGNVPLITLRPARLRGLDPALKYGLDVVGAAVALAALAPLALLALARGWLGGVRPLFCEYPVYGAGGRQITLRMFDPGVTTWLALRGVPALLWVIAGRLSLVGPRPVLWTRDDAVPPALWLTAVKPGVTGPWRLSGPEASLADQAVLDLAYVRGYSIWEDLRILCESIRRLGLSGDEPVLGRWQGLTAPGPFHFERTTGFGPEAL